MDRSRIEKFIATVVELGRGHLVEPEAKKLLQLCDIAVPQFFHLNELSEARGLVDKIGFPLVLKIVSEEINSKSDIGGVAIGIKDIAALEECWTLMLLNIADENPVAVIEGFVLEEMVPRGVEVTINAMKNDRFGTMIMFHSGAGEIDEIKNVSFRFGTVNRREALDMIGEVAGFKASDCSATTDSKGAKVPAKDISAIAEALVTISTVVNEIQGLKELEISPLIVYPKGAIAVDAKAALKR